MLGEDLIIDAVHSINITIIVSEKGEQAVKIRQMQSLQHLI